MRESMPGTLYNDILRIGNPDAVAWITGNDKYPDLNGLVKFYRTQNDGVLVEAELFNLPNVTKKGAVNVYALHIHEKGDCTKPFDQTGNHYSRTKADHPNHTGDLMPLLGNEGYAWMAFYDKRITIPEIIGRSIVVHAEPDDFTTQPSGNSGEKIGCGIIQ